MSPMYLGKEVSDDYMQGLIGAYRDGQKSVGANVEDGDQVIIDRLTAQSILAKPGAHDLGAEDGQNSQSDQSS